MNLPIQEETFSQCSKLQTSQHHGQARTRPLNLQNFQLLYLYQLWGLLGNDKGSQKAFSKRLYKKLYFKPDHKSQIRDMSILTKLLSVLTPCFWRQITTCSKLQNKRKRGGIIIFPLTIFSLFFSLYSINNTIFQRLLTLHNLLNM